MINRTVCVACLDTAMLLLVCVLECLALTGLDLHEWLGFALCPIVLVHVAMQWPWFVTQFQKIGGKGVYRTRINLFLNGLLLLLMSAVLISGVLASHQITLLVGESFGRVRMWREVHGWLNFTVVVLVGLHLALNWDWILGALSWRRRKAPVGTPTGRYTLNFGRWLGRGLSVFLAALMSAGVVYLVMAAMLRLPEDPSQGKSGVASVQGTTARNRLAPEPRPVSFAHGLEQLMVTAGVLVSALLVGRYLLRLRL